MVKIKIKSGIWSGSEAKVLNSIGDENLLVQLYNHKKIRVNVKEVEVIPRPKVVLATRFIGALDFSNPYTEAE